MWPAEYRIEFLYRAGKRRTRENDDDDDDDDDDDVPTKKHARTNDPDTVEGTPPQRHRTLHVTDNEHDELFRLCRLVQQRHPNIGAFELIRAILSYEGYERLDSYKRELLNRIREGEKSSQQVEDAPLTRIDQIRQTMVDRALNRALNTPGLSTEMAAMKQ